ncbi:aminotransferase class I/II-fold pyridoxal phosphate-dependent enzyme [Candidatus Peregrinibacteria bacterium]|nr:aminotransferase class I/II-fold pyridoxal phosphate-dependent enzyme [Candidatus Peregrinibacteria bacterium]
MTLDPQAKTLNEVIQETVPLIYDLLSNKGRAIHFPNKGILAQAADAKGKKINATIGIGLEEDGSPMALETIAGRIRLNKKEVFPYAGSFGIAELRHAWKQQMLEKNPTLSPERITLPVVTTGVTHALSMAGYLFVNPGDRLITPDLFWGNYRLIFEKAYDALFETFPAFAGEGFNVNGLRDALMAGGVGKKIVLLNFPNNPTGYTPTETEAEKIIQAIRQSAEAGNRLAVLIDDAYFGLIYEKDVLNESLFSRLATLHSNVLAVKIDGATKEDFAWGLRVGFITYGHPSMTPESAKALEEKTAGAIRGNISNTSHLSQSLILNATHDIDYPQQKKEKKALLKQRYETVKKILDYHPDYKVYFKALPFNSGYFMCVELQDELDGEAIRQKLLKEFDMGVIAFGKLLRIAFSSVPMKDLPTLFDAVFNACKSYNKQN